MNVESMESARMRYDPNRLLDAMLTRMQWSNDATLAKFIKVDIYVVRGIRCRTLPLGTSMLLWLQEASGVSIAELRQIMGDRRSRLRLSYAGRM